jgi:signal transduction histidine kinase
MVIEMISQTNLNMTRLAMFIVNLIVVLFMSALVYNTTDLICWNGLARGFLEKVHYVPAIPWKVPFYSVALLAIMFAGVVAREKYFNDEQAVLYVLSIIDILLCIGIICYLNMSYKGVLLIAISNIIIYIDGIKRRGIFIFAVILTYIFLDHDILSVKVTVLSINDYVQYYDAAQRLYIFGLRNVLTSVNEVVFIVFMIFVIQRQIEENQKIRELYSRLFQSAEELKIVNIQLQDYAKKSEEMARTRERNRLAREIHDTIGHTLTGIATGLEACIELSEKNMERMKAQIVKITDLARQGLVDVRRSVKQLRPDALERFSLIPAIQKLSDDINEFTKTRVSVNIEGPVPKLSADEEETVYRIVQEGITNAVRHGVAREIAITLSFSENNLHITITDDGIGCNDITYGFGLKHIRERVQMLKGYVDFRSSEENERGFAILVDLPLRGRVLNDQGDDCRGSGAYQAKP